MSEENLVTQEKSGSITFANDVLEIIAGVAACDIPGVAGMSGGLKDGIVEMLGKKNFTKGIKITKDEQDLVSAEIRLLWSMASKCRKSARISKIAWPKLLRR